jgi:hypothetical protein
VREAITGFAQVAKSWALPSAISLSYCGERGEAYRPTLCRCEETLDQTSGSGMLRCSSGTSKGTELPLEARVDRWCDRPAGR